METPEHLQVLSFTMGEITESANCTVTYRTPKSSDVQRIFKVTIGNNINNDRVMVTGCLILKDTTSSSTNISNSKLHCEINKPVGASITLTEESDY